MKIPTVIVVSAACSVSVAAATGRYVARHAALAGFWQNDALASTWAAVNGFGGAVFVLFAAFAFVLISCDAAADLRIARARLLELPPPRGPDPTDRTLQEVFAGTTFAAVAGQITAYEMGVAPLSLQRVLRGEIWRVYAKRMLAAGLAAVVFAVVLALLARSFAAPQPLPAVAGRAGAAAALLLAAIGGGAWLLMDDAIGKLAEMMTRFFTTQYLLITNAQDSLSRALAAPAGESGDSGATLLRIGSELALALRRIAEESAARHTAALEAQRDGGARIETALAQIEAVLRRAADEQRALADRLATAPSGDPAGSQAAGEAIARLAAAVEALAQRDTAGGGDERLLASLGRQERAVGDLGERWNELVGALRAMSAGLENFTGTAAPAPRGGGTALNDELDQLLDEVSNLEAATPGRPARG